LLVVIYTTIYYLLFAMLEEGRGKRREEVRTEEGRGEERRVDKRRGGGVEERRREERGEKGEWYIVLYPPPL